MYSHITQSQRCAILTISCSGIIRSELRDEVSSQAATPLTHHTPGYRYTCFLPSFKIFLPASSHPLTYDKFPAEPSPLKLVNMRGAKKVKSCSRLTHIKKPRVKCELLFGERLTATKYLFLHSWRQFHFFAFCVQLYFSHVFPQFAYFDILFDSNGVQFSTVLWRMCLKSRRPETS